MFLINLWFHTPLLPKKTYIPISKPSSQRLPCCLGMTEWKRAIPLGRKLKGHFGPKSLRWRRYIQQNFMQTHVRPWKSWPVPCCISKDITQQLQREVSVWTWSKLYILCVCEKKLEISKCQILIHQIKQEAGTSARRQVLVTNSHTGNNDMPI